MDANTQISELLRLQFIFECKFENNNLAIDEAHRFILGIFTDKRTNRLEDAEKLRNKLLRIVPTTDVDRSTQEQKILYLNYVIARIQNLDDMREYDSYALPYVTAYCSCTDQTLRLQYIEGYLGVLSNYITLNVKRNEDVIECHNNLTDCKNNKKKDTGKISQENILRAIRRYAGKQLDEVPKDLYTQLDNHFGSYSYPYTREKAASLPYDSKGRRKGTTRELMLEALGHTGNSTYYEHTNLICANYWGWKLPDVSQFESKVLSNAELTQKVFEKIKTRKSNMNIDFLAWKHLQAVGYNADRDDFKMIKSPEILRDYEEMWEKMVAGANEMIEQYNLTVPEHERRAKIPYIPTVR